MNEREKSEVSFCAVMGVRKVREGRGSTCGRVTCNTKSNSYPYETPPAAIIAASTLSHVSCITYVCMSPRLLFSFPPLTFLYTH